MMNTKPTLCPCISGRAYANCCQPLHDHKVTATSAEQLMCSRFSAFSVGNIAYLIETLHPKSRQPDDDLSLAKTIEATQWLGLKIMKHQSSGNKATVEFVAFYQDNGIAQLHEKSNFVKENNQWFYVDGEFLEPIKLSRNEPCFCGSGKKLKRCHNA